MIALATWLLALMLVAPLGLQPQSPASAQQEPPATGDDRPDEPPVHYRIGPQDQLKITVFDEPDLTNVYRVDAEGFVSFPLINRVAASGSTVSELQDRVRTMLAAGYLKNPQVRVEIEAYKSQSIIVSGEVRAPGKIAMTGAMTLVEALAAAGSPTSQASNEVTVSRQKRPSAPGAPVNPNDVEIIRVNLKDLQLGRAGRDIVLQDGDLVVISKAQTFFITGQVRTSGSFIWEPGMSVEQAIALAGGLNDRGSTRGIRATRVINGKTADVRVNLDDKVEPNDVIKIGSKIF
jgi:polysaccharide biosynthesis/export protein